MVRIPSATSTCHVHPATSARARLPPLPNFFIFYFFAICTSHTPSGRASNPMCVLCLHFPRAMNFCGLSAIARPQDSSHFYVIAAKVCVTFSSIFFPTFLQVHKERSEGKVKTDIKQGQMVFKLQKDY